MKIFFGNTLVLLISFPMLLTISQILFKKSTQNLTTFNFSSLIVNYWLALAIICNMASLLLWIKILEVTPLSRAYAFAAISFITVPIFSALIFGESINIRHGLGYFMIASGITLIYLQKFI